MALDLRANTAVDVLIGPFVDSTDGDTDETGLTLSQADIKLSKNGQALAQKNDATSAAHDADGYYNCELDSTDTNTEGTLVLKVHESGALNVRHEYNVLSEAAWDSLYIAKDDGFMDVNIKTIGRADTQETEANNLESACSNYSVTRGLTGTAVPAAAADAAGGLPISDGGGLDLDAQLATTDQIGAAGVGLTEAGGDGDHLTEAGGDGDHLTESGGTGDQLTAINLPNQTMDITGSITGNLSGSVGSCTGDVGGDVKGNVDGTVTGVTPSSHTPANVKTAMEADQSMLYLLMETLVYKMIITEANGNAEKFDASLVSQGTIAAAFTSIAGETKREDMVI